MCWDLYKVLSCYVEHWVKQKSLNPMLQRAYFLLSLVFVFARRRSSWSVSPTLDVRTNKYLVWIFLCGHFTDQFHLQITLINIVLRTVLDHDGLGSRCAIFKIRPDSRHQPAYEQRFPCWLLSTPPFKLERCEWTFTHVWSIEVCLSLEPATLVLSMIRFQWSRHIDIFTIIAPYYMSLLLLQRK